MSFQVTLDIQADADTVWSVMRDLPTWPAWTPTFTAIQPAGGEAAGMVGRRYAVRQPKLPPTVMTIQSWEPGRGFAWASTTPLLRAWGNHVIRPVDSRRCSVTLELRFLGLAAPLARWLYAKLVREYVTQEAQGLKRRAEQIASPAAPTP